MTVRSLENIIGKDPYYKQLGSTQTYEKSVDSENVDVSVYTYKITKGDAAGKYGLTKTYKNAAGKTFTNTFIGTKEELKQALKSTNTTNLKTKSYTSDMSLEKGQDVSLLQNKEWDFSNNIEVWQSIANSIDPNAAQLKLNKAQKPESSTKDITSIPTKTASSDVTETEVTPEPEASTEVMETKVHLNLRQKAKDT